MMPCKPLLLCLGVVSSATLAATRPASPTQLAITDHGDGTVTLTWQASNFEKDHAGYSVYGFDQTAAGAFPTRKPFPLLQGNGDLTPRASHELPMFSYTSNNPFRIHDNAPDPAALKPQASSLNDILPLHRRHPTMPDIPSLPTCYVKPATQNCVDYQAPFVIKSQGFGKISYQVSDLNPRHAYCFMVASNSGNGRTSSRLASNVACINLDREMQATMSLPIADGYRHYLRLRDWQAASLDSGQAKLSFPASLAQQTQDDPYYDEDTANALRIEAKASTDGAITLVSGNNTFIRDLGYQAQGFANLPEIPKFTNALRNQGYTAEGQAIQLRAGYLYAVAVGDADKQDTLNYRYHLLWVKPAQTIERGADFSFTLRLASTANQPNRRAL